MSTRIADRPPSGWRRFIWNAAGAYVPFLQEEQCAVDQPKYTSIGSAVVMTAMINGVALGFVAKTVSGSLVGAVVCGVIWFLLILNMDRAFVSASPKTQAGLTVRQALGLGLRLVVAILVGYFSSGMIIQLFFKPDLEPRVRMLVARSDGAAEQKADSAFPGIQQLEAENTALTRAVDNAKFSADQAYNRMQDQASGRRGSPEGFGRQFHQDSIRYEEKKGEWIALRDRNRAQAALNNEKIEATKAERAAYLQDLKAANQGSINGFLLREQALIELEAEHSTARKWHLILLALLIVIDLLPLGYKMLSPYGPYDARLEAEKELRVETLADQTQWFRLEREIRAVVRKHDAEAQRTSDLADVEADLLLADVRRKARIETGKAEIHASEAAILQQYKEALKTAVESSEWRERLAKLSRSVMDRLAKKLNTDFAQQMGSNRTRHRRWASKVSVPKVADVSPLASREPDITWEMPPGLGERPHSDDGTLPERL